MGNGYGEEDDGDGGGYPRRVIPAGCSILISMQSVHRNPVHWPDPGRYDPWRFVEDVDDENDGVDGENGDGLGGCVVKGDGDDDAGTSASTTTKRKRRRRKEIEPYTFLPFIEGPRNCLGQHLALLESKMVISMLSQRYDLRLSDGDAANANDEGYDPRHRYIVPIVPKDGIRISVSMKG